MNAQERNSEATIESTYISKNVLTSVATKFSVTGMVRYKDVEKRLDQQWDADTKSLKQNYARQNELLRYVVEFNDLEREARMREDRARRVIELLGEEKFADTRKEMLQGKDVSKEVVIATNDDSPLWEFMKPYWSRLVSFRWLIFRTRYCTLAGRLQGRLSSPL
jgi:vacuolar-type H+-ATPase subunit I/STV1